MEEDIQTIVLVGVTGDGKSTTGNTLSGQSVFEVSDGFKSATQSCAHVDYFYKTGFFRVIDTVGLHDTDLTVEETKKRFSAFADHTPLGIDVFLFIVRWGRFKPEHEAALDAFVANCGEEALKHTMLCFTHCPLSEEKLQNALDTQAPASLRAWLPRLCGAIGIDNDIPPDSSDPPRPALHTSMESLVLAPNGGLRYSNEALAEARQRFDDKAEAERQAFAAAVSDWRRGEGPVTIEREYTTDKEVGTPDPKNENVDDQEQDGTMS